MKDRFIIRDIGEEGAMVYDQKRDEVHFLNPTAYLIWTLSKEKKSSIEIEKTLGEKYHTQGQKDVSLDVKACLKELREKELLSVSYDKKPRIKKGKREKED
jgi:hypothetical protein